MHARVTHGHDDRQVTYGHGDRYKDKLGKSHGKQAGQGAEQAGSDGNAGRTPSGSRDSNPDPAATSASNAA